MDPQATPTRLRSRGPKSILSSRSSMYVTGFFFTEFYLIFLFDRLSVSSNDFYLVLPSFFCWFLIVAHALPRALLFFLPSFTDLFVPPSLSRRTVFSWPSNDFYRVLPSFLGGSSLFATLDAGRALDARAKKKTRDDRRSGNWRHRRRSAGCCVSISPLTGAYRVIFAAVPSFARSSLFPRFSLAT